LQAVREGRERPVRVIGMMSGTSADGIDAVLCEVEGAPPEFRVSVLAGLGSPFAPELQQRIHLAARADTSDVESICLLDVGARRASVQGWITPGHQGAAP
jgi:anhydro-N-acetylmuramic acid kinase